MFLLDALYLTNCLHGMRERVRLVFDVLFLLYPFGHTCFDGRRFSFTPNDISAPDIRRRYAASDVGSENKHTLRSKPERPLFGKEEMFSTIFAIWRGYAAQRRIHAFLWLPFHK